ncbi:hypothetical protein [Myxococcus hansupus]|nr:hypothetical protein [Myxococcus hansupus]
MNKPPSKQDDILALTQKINNLEHLHQKGRLHPSNHTTNIQRDLQNIRRDGNGLVIPESVSPALKATAIAASYAEGVEPGAPTKLADPIKSQRELFSIFQDLFASITGRDHSHYSSTTQINDDILKQLKSNYKKLAKNFNHTIERLVKFYNTEKSHLLREAQQIAGLKIVLGGQSQFLGSQLSGVRQMMLYADTILIADPVYHFIEADIRDVAIPTRIATTLFHLLALKPLVDAELAYPAIFVFPSFERALEARDVVTQQGIFQLAIKLIRNATGLEIHSMQEVADFAVEREAEFMTAITRSQIFLPPGYTPPEPIDAYKACGIYLDEIAGTRPEPAIALMKSLPPGHLALQGILERVGPQYHLQENAEVLSAQPMVVLPVHWHYMERISEASANELERKGILPKGSLGTFRGLQDPSLTWLGNVPIDALVNLRRDEANKEFRKRMAELSKELDSASILDAQKVAREVAHGLASLINSHQKEIRELEAKWFPKYAKTFMLSGGAGLLTLAAPYLPILGSIGAAGSAMAAVGGITAAYARDKIDERAERKRLSRSLIGVLASARQSSK